MGDRVAISATTADLTTAITLRLTELGHNLSPSHVQALIADILQVLVTDSANIVAHSAADNPQLKPPPRTKV